MGSGPAQLAAQDEAEGVPRVMHAHDAQLATDGQHGAEARVVQVDETGAIDITVDRRNPGARPGLRIHVVARLEHSDVRVHDRVPLTAPARTLLDLAEVVPVSRLERAVEEARIRRLVRARQLLDVLE